MNQRLLFILFALLFGQSTYAQPHAYWARNMDIEGASGWGPTINRLRYNPDRMILLQDSFKNFYIIAEGSGNFDWNEEPLTANGTNVLKLDSSGRVLWGRHFAYAQLEEQGYQFQIAKLTGNGRLYFPLLYKDSMDADPSLGTWWLKDSTRYRGWSQAIIALDTAGNLIRPYQVSSGSGSMKVFQLDVNNKGEMLAFGNYLEKVNLNISGKLSDTFFHTPRYFGNGIVVKWDSTGAPVVFDPERRLNYSWANMFYRFPNDTSSSFEGIGILESFGSMANVNLDTSNVVPLDNPNNYLGRLVRIEYDPFGIAQTIQIAPGDVSANLGKLRFGPDGDIYLSAFGYRRSVNTITRSGAYKSEDYFPNNDYHTGFLFRLTRDMEIKWIAELGSEDRQRYYHPSIFDAFDVNERGEILCGGSFYRKVQLPANPQGQRPLMYAQDTNLWQNNNNYLDFVDGVLMQLDSNGHRTWSTVLPYTHFAHIEKTIGPEQTFYATGFLDEPEDLDYGPDSIPTKPWFSILKPFNKYRTFFLKLGPVEPRGILLPNDTVLCLGERFEITIEDLRPDDRIRWNTGDTTASIWVDSSGLYSVIIQNEHRSFSDSVQVWFAAPPTVYIGEDTAFCDVVDYVLLAKSDAKYFQWNTGDTTKELYINSDGTYSLVVRDSIFCPNSDTIHVAKINSPYPINTDTTRCAEWLVLDAANPGCTYVWSTGSNQRQLPVFSSGVYSVTISNGFCQITDSLFVNLTHPDSCESWVFVPNAFTPNGDGLNSVFAIAYHGVEKLEVRIYDRWGEELFFSDDTNFAWDGIYKGELVPEGVYVYLIQARLRQPDGTVKIEQKKGSLTLLR